MGVMLFDTRECPECKSEIPADATRCKHCTQAVEPIDFGELLLEAPTITITTRYVRNFSRLWAIGELSNVQIEHKEEEVALWPYAVAAASGLCGAAGAAMVDVKIGVGIGGITLGYVIWAVRNRQRSSKSYKISATGGFTYSHTDETHATSVYEALRKATGQS